jgi:hypothetical protein
LFYVINSIVNSIGSGIPSALVALLAAFGASGVYVALGATMAPTYRRYVGLALAGVVVVLAVFIFGKAITQGNGSETPLWYQSLFDIVIAGGAVWGAVVAFSERDKEAPPRKKPTNQVLRVARWIVLVPTSLVLPILIIAPLELIAAQHVDADLMKVEGQLLCTVLSVAVAAAIAPSAKRTVGILLASVWILDGLLTLILGLSRTLNISWFQTHLHHEIVQVLPTWYVVLNAGAVIYAANVGILIAAEASHRQRDVNFPAGHV